MSICIVLMLAQQVGEARSSLIWRFVLENPWPLASTLIAVGLVIGWLGLREGLANRQRLGLGLAAVGLMVLALGYAITTPAEHASAVVHRLIDAVVSEDTTQAKAQFASDAVMTVGSPSNAGVALEFIASRLDRLADRYDITSNRVTTLRRATVSGKAGEVRLSCMTEVAEFPYPSVSRWLMRVEQQPDSTWLITRITCMEINGQTPSSAELW